MLVLSRRLGEKIVFPTLGITVTVTSVERNRVKLAVAAPEAVQIERPERLAKKPELKRRDENDV
jgi:carbon storage regulator CsrA